eukprot:6386736-Prymnesium_polylepis.1
MAENDQTPHADDYCPGELFVVIHLRDSQTSTYGVPFRQSSLDMYPCDFQCSACNTNRPVSARRLMR